ncbi:MAG: hypothetical protein WAK04_12455 [Xanthobacteraceae bacterium]
MIETCSNSFAIAFNPPNHQACPDDAATLSSAQCTVLRSKFPIAKFTAGLVGNANGKKYRENQQTPRLSQHNFADFVGKTAQEIEPRNISAPHFFQIPRSPSS